MSEFPTPYSICVCSFLTLYSDTSCELYGSNDEDIFREYLEYCRHHLFTLIQELIKDTNYSTVQNSSGIRFLEFIRLIEHVERKSMSNIELQYDRQSYELLFSKKLKSILNSSISSVDSLVELFDSFREAIKPDIVDPSSLIGIYIRQRILTFDELPFECIARILTSLETYLNDDESMTNNINFFYSRSDEVRGLHRECRNMENMAFHQVNRIDSLDSNHFFITEHNLERPIAHYHNLLKDILLKERNGATDNLHRYFDYVMINEKRRMISDPNKHGSMQYAAILLAMLHYHFGNESLSFKSTEESIRVAQQRNDRESVAFALAWMQKNKHGVEDNYSNSRSEEILRLCASRASEHNLQLLYSTALFSSAISYTGKSDIEFGSSTFSPTHLWSLIQSNSNMNLFSSSTASHSNLSISTSSNKATQITHLTKDDALKQLTKQYLLMSGVWETMGNTPMSSLMCSTSLLCYGEAMSINDFEIAMHKVTFNAFFGSCTSPNILNYISTSSTNYKRSKANRRLQKGWANTKIFQSSLRNLHLLKQTFKGKHLNELWQHSIYLLLHRWALYVGKYTYAKHIGTLLQSSPIIGNNHNVETIIQSIQALALNHIYNHAWRDAMKLTRNLIRLSSDNSRHFHHARFLLQLAEIYLQAQPSNPFKAVPIILNCIYLCQTFALDSVRACAVLLLAKTRLFLHKAEDAQVLLKSILPTIVQHAPISFHGEAWLTLAKCSIVFAKSSNNLESSKRHFSQSLVCLEKACCLYSKIDDYNNLSECYHIQARIHDSTGNYSKRNVAAKHFVETKSLLMKNKFDCSPMRF